MTNGIPSRFVVGRHHPSAALAEVCLNLLFPFPNRDRAPLQEHFRSCSRPKNIRLPSRQALSGPKSCRSPYLLRTLSDSKHIARGVVQRLSPMPVHASNVVDLGPKNCFCELTVLRCPYCARPPGSP